MDEEQALIQLLEDLEDGCTFSDAVFNANFCSMEDCYDSMQEFPVLGEAIMDACGFE